VIAVLAIVLSFLLPLLAAAIGLAVLITGVISLAKRTPTWLRFRSRKAAAGVSAMAAAAVLMFGGVAAAMQPNEPAQRAESARLVELESSGSGNEAQTRPTPSSTRAPTPVTTVREEVVTEPVPFEEATVNDPAMPNGQTQVTTTGQIGEKTLTYRVTLVDGIETNRELISDIVTRAPITQMTSVGTYVAPPPPPPAPAQPAGCHANYADACVPVASDVDCGGGSGDGPAYFDGVARVVGADVYDLDRDGDGHACEPW
jgi:hypothetical protein